MVYEVLSDLGSVKPAGHAHRFQLALRPDTGQHQDLG